MIQSLSPIVLPALVNQVFKNVRISPEDAPNFEKYNRDTLEEKAQRLLLLQVGALS